jgi:coenzyme F420-0:L-glutamate ligase/coenzyme F420-1:gamma-L-glutamate ligase
VLALVTEKDPRLVEVFLRESAKVLRVRPNTLVVEPRLRIVCTNAVVDRSSVAPHGDPVDETLLLLPAGPDGTCAAMRALACCRRRGRSQIIKESQGRAWRTGTVGVVIGAAGFPALHDMRGQPALFDYTLQVTQIGLTGELPAAAPLLMGQAAVGRLVFHACGVPHLLRDGTGRELIRLMEPDLFRKGST